MRIRKGGLLVSCVACLVDTAGNAAEEGLAFADACWIETAAGGDQARHAVSGTARKPSERLR